MMSGDDLLRGNPIRKSEEDLLDRGDLVSHLSNLIVQDSINDSCTIGLIGKWGSGKSSVINLIEERVSELTRDQENSSLSDSIPSTILLMRKEYPRYFSMF